MQLSRTKNMASAVRVLCARVCVCLSSFLLTLPAVNPAQCSFYFSQDFFFFNLLGFAEFNFIID